MTKQYRVTFFEHPPYSGKVQGLGRFDEKKLLDEIKDDTGWKRTVTNPFDDRPENRQWVFVIDSEVVVNKILGVLMWGTPSIGGLAMELIEGSEEEQGESDELQGKKEGKD